MVNQLKIIWRLLANAKRFPPNFELREYPFIYMEQAGYKKLNQWKLFVVIELKPGKKLKV